MNHAFIAAIMRSPVVPSLDPWFAGGDLTVYYYLGHWMMGCLGVVTGIPPEVVFNLIPATVYGVGFVMLYATGSLFLRRWRWLPLAVLLLVPLSVPWFLAVGGDLYSAFQDTNWIIAGARVEFPVFSLFLGNVHAFEMAVFNQILLIFLLGFVWLRWGGLDLGGGNPCPPHRPLHRFDAAPLLLGCPRLRPGRRGLPPRTLSSRARSLNLAPPSQSPHLPS